MWKESGKKPIGEYLMWAFGISWIMIGLIIGMEHLQLFPKSIEKGIVMILIGFGAGLSPAYAVFIILHKYQNTGAKNVIHRIFQCNRVKLTIGVTTLIMAGQLIKCMVTEQYLGSPIYYFILMLPLMIFGGGLEEIGWRGFLQPALEERTNYILATLLQGVLWSIWHIPLWFVANANQSKFSFLSFLFYCVSFSFSLALLYKITQCVFAVIVLHAWGNVVLGGMFTFGALTEFPSAGTLIFYGIEITISIVAAMLIDRNRKEKRDRKGKSDKDEKNEIKEKSKIEEKSDKSEKSDRMKELLIINTTDRMQDEVSAVFTSGEIINTSNLTIHNCIGCNSCWIKTPGRCAIKDDFESIFQRIIKADTVVFVADEKLGMVSYQMKNIVDRMIALDLPYTCIKNGQARHALRYNKQWNFMLVVTGAENIGYINKWFDRVAVNFHSTSAGTYLIKNEEEIKHVLCNI